MTTQTRNPWRTVARTAFQFVIGLTVVFPFVVGASGLDPATIPWLAGVVAVAAAVTRVMAVPQVEAFLKQFAPFLSAEPKK